MNKKKPQIPINFNWNNMINIGYVKYLRARIEYNLAEDIKRMKSYRNSRFWLYWYIKEYGLMNFAAIKNHKELIRRKFKELDLPVWKANFFIKKIESTAKEFEIKEII